MRATQILVLSLVTALVGSAFWNVRLARENRRLAFALKEARSKRVEKPAAPLAPPKTEAQLQLQIQDEHDTIQVLSNRLREAKTPLPSERATLDEQIASEKRLIAQLKDKRTRLKKKHGKARAGLPEVNAQLESETLVLQDLQRQRMEVAKAPRQPANAKNHADEAEVQRLQEELDKHRTTVKDLEAQLAARRH